jgi:hypothetical protein
LSRLSGAYRRDAKAIRAVRKDGKLPDSLEADLALIGSTQELGRRIDERAAAMERSLGVYARGRDTDPAATRQAIDVAETILARRPDRPSLAATA